MKNLLKKALLNNVQIKLFSLVLGYGLWSIVNQSHADDMWMDIPLCFCETAKTMNVDAPETVKINLTGKRADLRVLDRNGVAVHIDTRRLSAGKNIIALSDRQVLLPETIQITGWAPTHVNINVKKET